MASRRSWKNPRPRGTQVFNKPALSISDLLDQYVERGMILPDRDRAARYLRHIGYYRLSPYTIPFQRSSDHTFSEGTVFDDVLDLCVFDRALRMLVIDALERVEVAVRAALTDHMAMTYNDAHWYLDSSHFHNSRTHAGLLKIVRELCDKRLQGTAERPSGRLVHPSALEHYLTTYGTPDLPPSWVMVEMITIGSLQSTYDNLQRRTDRMAIARTLGLNEPILASWLKTYVRVRNICAHHGRLWNVGLGVYPRLPTGSAVSWLEGDQSMPAGSTKRLYPVLVSLQSILDTVSPRSTWARRLEALVSSRPEMNLRGMGIPAGWSEDPFWKRHLTETTFDKP